MQLLLTHSAGHARMRPQCSVDPASPFLMQLFFTPLSQALRLVIHLGEPLPEDRPSFQFDFRGLFALFAFSFLLMMWTNGVGASTGMFVPALAVGAVGGLPCQAPLMCACCLCHTLLSVHQHGIVQTSTGIICGLPGSILGQSPATPRRWLPASGTP